MQKLKVGRRLFIKRLTAAARLIGRILPRGHVAAISAVVLAITATALCGLTPSATLGASSLQRAAIAELFRSYNPDTGLIGRSWWQAAVALSTVETYAQTTGDASYDTAIARAFALQSGGRETRPTCR